MKPMLNDIFAAGTALTSAVFGWKAGDGIGFVVVANANTPEWVAIISGPVGAIICLVFAVKWLAGRISKADAREERREERREELLQSVIIIAESSKAAIEQHSEQAQRTETALSNLASAINRCPK
jgi:L-lactate permease